MDIHKDFSQCSSLLYFLLPTCGIINKDTIIWIISGLSILKALGQLYCLYDSVCWSAESASIAYSVLTRPIPLANLQLHTLGRHSFDGLYVYQYILNTLGVE